MILLDTHVVAWLYAGQVERFPPHARELLETAELRISPTVALELQYLHEIGRLSQPPDPVLRALERAIGLGTSDVGLAALVGAAVDLGWTRDPFDRLLVAHAELESAPLLTADETIRDNYERAVWTS